MIVKAGGIGGSLGVGIKNVVSTPSEMKEEVKIIQWIPRLGVWYRGVIAEQFITGPEFTTLVVGSNDAPDQMIYYTPVEKCFMHPCLKRKNSYPYEDCGRSMNMKGCMPLQGNFMI